MRVIAGEFRSRRLKSVPGTDVRPTPDRLRESLFSILAPRLRDAIFLDAYAGSGAVGIEALSRGAKHVILIERNSLALGVIRDNIASLGIGDRITVLRGKAAALLGDRQTDIAFIDPPYDQPKEYGESLKTLVATTCQVAIAQHSVRLVLDDAYQDLARTRQVRQGDNVLSFFERAAARKSTS